MMDSDTNEPIWHLLDFFCDDENSCALTVFAGGKRFHIIANAKKLSNTSETAQDYHKLVRCYRSREEGEKASDHRKDRSTGSDSAVDLNHDREDNEEESSGDNLDDQNPEGLLQSWMLEPLLSTFRDLVSSRTKSHHQDVQEWYKSSTKFFELSLDPDNDELQAVELEAGEELEHRMQNLLPELSLPKYITESIKAPMYNASELSVIQASNQPPGTPYHPCRVKVKGKRTFFLKIVDKSQPQAIKRELQILNRISKDGINQKIRAPILEGLVCFDDAEDTAVGQKRIMGFLQTDIRGAKPLTDMLDASIPQDKRERWANEAKKLKETLHKHDIIWGDAKADNFVVDANEDLWIIDFGGSYTEGWVEHDLKETKEGDHMGTEKTVNALIDPINNTCDPQEIEDEDEDEDEDEAEDEDEDDCKSTSREKTRSAKRKAHTREETEGDGEGTCSKRRRRSK